MNDTSSAEVSLPRSLGPGDLILLKVAAIININLVPGLALYGRVSLGLWLLAFITFFVPQAIAVIVLARRFPGEGGIYTWCREQFGNAHGFLVGWCYWTNNLFYIPTQLVYIASVTGAALGGRFATERGGVLVVALLWLALITGANIRGLGVGKWIQNVGALGTLGMMGFLLFVAMRAPPIESSAAATPMAGPGVFGSFSVMCLAFVGGELASTMGQELRDPERSLRRAMLVAGGLALLSYLCVTGILLRLVPAAEMGALDGLLQAVERGAGELLGREGVALFALLLVLSLGGAVSAWFAGSARVPFVAGLDRALPARLGAIHPVWGTPHVALLTQGLLTGALTVLVLAGSSLMEAYQVFLKTTVVIQLIPFLYMFTGLTRLDRSGPGPRLAGWLGLITTASGIVAAFVPTAEVGHAWVFEVKLILGCVLTIGIGLYFYRRSRRSRAVM